MGEEMKKKAMSLTREWRMRKNAVISRSEENYSKSIDSQPWEPVVIYLLFFLVCSDSLSLCEDFELSLPVLCSYAHSQIIPESPPRSTKVSTIFSTKYLISKFFSAVNVVFA